MSARWGRADVLRMIRHAWVPGLLILACCGGGPSGSDIKDALQTASNVLLGRLAPSFEDVSNVNCQGAQGKPGYVCSFNATSFSKLTNARSSQVSEARFVQDSSKWVMMADK